MTDWEIRMHRALLDLSGRPPSTKGLPPTDRAQRLYAEIERRQRVALDAMGATQGPPTERIDRAIEALNAAPALHTETMTTKEIALYRVIIGAREILMEGRDPPSRRDGT